MASDMRAQQVIAPSDSVLSLSCRMSFTGKHYISQLKILSFFNCFATFLYFK